MHRDTFLLPDGLPPVLQPDTAFKIRIMGGPSEDWIFRATRESETRELLAHKLRRGIAMDVGRAPALFAVGEVLRIINFQIIFVPAVLVKEHIGGQGFIRLAANSQTIDELIAEVEARLGER